MGTTKTTQMCSLHVAMPCARITMPTLSGICVNFLGTSVSIDAGRTFVKGEKSVVRERGIGGADAMVPNHSFGYPSAVFEAGACRSAVDRPPV